jgi:hypothetical protein
MLGKNVRWDGDWAHLLCRKPRILVTVLEQERATKLKLAPRGLYRYPRLIVFLLVHVIKAPHLLLVRALLAAPLLIRALQHGWCGFGWRDRGGNKLAGKHCGTHILLLVGANFGAAANP